ncbi:LOW QUALITY PROTEIN: hypothetical protein Cgig2_018367 [Carnegiea gigantea]|uniref:Uncharacterized protein n=1 Tax=Carnegiea gigantea TaxID=171969 RepID=A0A9Q1Q7U1_9CARY|nr:LOW QUALITY PROTEIN: hypothetical protein Cgig2_018367 [Carnegiea gigantea]
MVTFMDKTPSGRRYLHIQPNENDVHREATRLGIRSFIMSLYNPTTLETSETFLLSNHSKMDKNSLLTNCCIMTWSSSSSHGLGYHCMGSLLSRHFIEIRDAGCIHTGTVNVASFMASSIGYCLSTDILASIYKGLNETSHSYHPIRGPFSCLFPLYMVGKIFDVYKLNDEVSSSSAQRGSRTHSFH